MPDRFFCLEQDRKEGQLFPPPAASEVQEEKKPETNKQVKATEPKEQKSGSRPSPRQMVRLVKAVLPSFKVNRFRLYLNTGDVIWNAWLFPIFYRWHFKGHDVAVHFHGPSSLVLDIENSLHRIIGALLHEYLKPNISWKPTSKT